MYNLDFLQAVTSAERFIRFSNSDGKRWIMPIDGMNLAMHLYQPGGIKGKLVKNLLPYLYWVSPVKRVIEAEIIRVDLCVSLREAINKALNVTDFQFSIFEGTPSVHQKATIQISQGGKIIAYCKVSDNPDVVKLFQGEQQTLGFLHSRGVGQIPECLFCGHIGGDLCLFIQSTSKSRRSKVVHKWNEKHMQFLDSLHARTKEQCLFEDSGLARSITYLDSNLSLLPHVDREVLKVAIAKVRTYYVSKTVEFSLYHGDFTPWNMFFESDELFVFDFEYAHLSYPQYLDYIHFLTQSAIFVDHLSTDEIYALYANERLLACEQSRTLILCYLLDITSRYIGRDNGLSSDATQDMIRTWCTLANKIITDK